MIRLARILLLSITTVLTMQCTHAPSATNSQKKLIRLGTEYGGWTIPTHILSANSICYCVGAGEDISFDAQLKTTYGCHVYIFDPTPKAITHIDYIYKNILAGKPAFINNKPESYSLTPADLPFIHFLPYGLSHKNELLKLYAPPKPEYASYSSINLHNTSSFIEVPCKEISTIMQELGHTHIDLLKIDIEGSEYQVIENMIKEKIFPTILCIEFHQSKQYSKDQTLKDLILCGYKIVSTYNKTDVTLVLQAAL